MTTPSSPVALLDQLDAAREAARDGGWPGVERMRLIDEAEPKLTAAVRAVLDAHVPWYEIKGVRHEHTVSASCEAVGCDGESCDGEHEVPACQECRWSDGDVDGYQFWPCPTVRAITAALSVTP